MQPRQQRNRFGVSQDFIAQKTRHYALYIKIIIRIYILLHHTPYFQRFDGVSRQLVYGVILHSEHIDGLRTIIYHCVHRIRRVVCGVSWPNLLRDFVRSGNCSKV